ASAQSGGSWARFASLTLCYGVGLGVGLMSLLYVGKAIRRRRASIGPGAMAYAETAIGRREEALHLSMTIAAGSGLPNFSEGLTARPRSRSCRSFAGNTSPATMFNMGCARAHRVRLTGLNLASNLRFRSGRLTPQGPRRDGPRRSTGDGRVWGRRDRLRGEPRPVISFRCDSSQDRVQELLRLRESRVLEDLRRRSLLQDHAFVEEAHPT